MLSISRSCILPQLLTNFFSIGDSITLPLNVELYSAEKMLPVEKPIMHIDPSTKPVMNGDGICKLRIRISECSMALGNRKFVIHISAANNKGAFACSLARSSCYTIHQQLTLLTFFSILKSTMLSLL